MNSNRFLSWVRNRRGAAVVLLIVMLAALLGILSVVIDTSRLMALKAEMQTAVDAAALAGVLALSDGAGDGSRDVAIEYALKNFAEAEGVVVLPEDVTFGIWDRFNWTFNPLPSAVGADAIDVQARRGVINYLAWILGVPRSGAWARATAWAAAPISETNNCVKPWALPEELLDLNNDDVVDDWEVEEAEGNEFTLKSATGGAGDELGSSGIPSFFYPVVLPPFWDATTGEYVDVSGESGAAEYREKIGTCLAEWVGVGDSILTEPGNMPGPTVQGARELCGTIVDDICWGEDGTGVSIIAGFWDSDVDPIGRRAVEVATLASFRLLRVYSQGEHGVVVGRFEELLTSGSVGSGASTAVTIMLVR